MSETKTNPEWEKLGPGADVHFLYNREAFTVLKVDPKAIRETLKRARKSRTVKVSQGKLP